MSCSIEKIKKNALDAFLLLQDTPDYQSLTSKTFDSTGTMRFNYKTSEKYKTKAAAIKAMENVRKAILPLVKSWATGRLKKDYDYNWFDVNFSETSVLLKFFFPKKLEDHYKTLIEKTNKEANAKFSREIDISEILLNKYMDNQDRLLAYKAALEKSESSESIFNKSSSPAEEIDDYKLTCDI